jgi:hypothetical protein
MYIVSKCQVGREKMQETIQIVSDEDIRRNKFIAALVDGEEETVPLYFHLNDLVPGTGHQTVPEPLIVLLPSARDIWPLRHRVESIKGSSGMEQLDIRRHHLFVMYKTDQEKFLRLYEQRMGFVHDVSNDDEDFLGLRMVGDLICGEFAC